MILLDFCSMPWWLPWLLPFLLGLALGWLLWGKFKSRIADLEAEISGLKRKITSLEGDLKGCHSEKADLAGDISIAKGRMREAETALEDYKSSTKGKSSGGSGSSLAASSGGSDSKTSSGNDSNGKGSSGSGSGTSSDADLSSITSSLTGSASDAVSGITGAAMGAAGKSSGKSSAYAKLGNDKLQIIEGIGPKMEKVLKENGVNTHADLGNQTPESLKAILGKYGDSYRIIDPSTWAQQAKMAADGDYEGLIELQKKLDTGVANANKRTDSKLEKMMVRLGLIKSFKQDDLKAVEGIGPKIEQLLHNAGIKTWAALASSETDTLKGILKDAGSRFSLADPGTWAKQADLANKGEWDELQTYQDFLQGGK